MTLTVTSARGIVGTTGQELGSSSRRSWVLRPGPAFTETWATIGVFTRAGALAFPAAELASPAAVLRRVVEAARNPGHAVELNRTSQAHHDLDLAILGADGNRMTGRVTISEYLAPGSPFNKMITKALGSDPARLGFEGSPPHYVVALVQDIPLPVGT